MTVELTENIHANIQQEFKIMAELKMIQKENIDGVYVIPSFESSFLWFGVLFVRDGYFADGVFRFNISLPKEFPNTTEVPTVIFQSELVHPLICPFTGITNVIDAFASWQSTDNHLWQLLKYIQFIFQHPVACVNGIDSPTKISNQEVADLLLMNNNIDVFAEKAKDCVRLSREKVYDEPPTDDKHYIRFSTFDEEIHRNVLENITNKLNRMGSSASPPPSGLSWVNEGEYKPLSK